MDPRTTIPELFAIVRQWVPQVQHKIDVIGNEVRNTNANVSFILYHIEYIYQLLLREDLQLFFIINPVFVPSR